MLVFTILQMQVPLPSGCFGAMGYYICTGDVGVRLLLLIHRSGRVIIWSGKMKLSCRIADSMAW
jgi:hypothetical protein